MARRAAPGGRDPGVIAGRLPRAWIAALLAFVMVAARAQAPEYPGATWNTVSPESAGWSAQKLQEADAIAREIGTSAYLVVHKGRIVHSYGRIDSPSNIHSARKSILSILVGIQHDRGRIDLDRDLQSLGIDDRPALTDVEKRATIRQLLEARSCIYHPSAYETREMTAHHPARGTCAPGERWEYNNWDFNALGTIFKQLTGSSVFDSLQQDLAKPLGFEDFTPLLHTRWVYERALSEHPAYEMRLSARDLARVGLLMARGGMWQDERIVSEAWVRESTAKYSDAGPGLGYGYLWWVGVDRWHFGQRFPGPVFSARGNFGQFVIVDPVRDIVVVHKVNSDGTVHANVENRKFNPLFAKVMQAVPAN